MTPAELAVDAADQLATFWREALVADEGGPKTQAKYNRFLTSMQAQVAHLPQSEQDELFQMLVNLNAEYISLARKDRNALMISLGVQSRPAFPARQANVAAETVVRATVWQSISALFRAFR